MTTTGQAEKYKEAWRAELYNGFSEGTLSQHSTPLLDRAITYLHGRKSDLPQYVLEAGAGLGGHAIRFVREGFFVTANDFSPVAVGGIRRKKQRLPYSSQTRLQIVQGDIADCLRAQESDTIAGFYAHSLFHTFSSNERLSVYEEIHRTQPRGGLIAISFKAEGDYVQNRGGATLKRTDAGIIIADFAGGIPRLFVTDPNPLIEELANSGYDVLETYSWKVPKNGDGTSSEFRKFIGLLAIKSEGDQQ